MFDWLSKPKMEWTIADNFSECICIMVFIFLILVVEKLTHYIRAKRMERWIDKNNKYWERKGNKDGDL